MTPDPLRGDLDVAVDDDVEFTLTVSNPGPEPRELRFRNGLAADFVVLRDEEPVWRWSDGRMFTQALWSETIAPDESVAYEAAWPDPVPGAYEVVGRLAAENADVEARAEFTV